MATVAQYEQRDATRKAEGKALSQRATEAGTAAVTSLGNGALLAWKPDLDDTAGGFLSPHVIETMLGVVIMLLLWKKRNSMLREVGSGLLFAGGVPLLNKAGAKLYEAATA
jgi:hypothetical protein